MPRQKIFKRAVARAHGVKFVFPNRRGVGVGHFVGQRVNQQVSAFGRLKNFFDDLQEAALNQVVDNRGACRLGADAVNVLELFLSGGVLNVFVDVFHAFDEARRREMFRRSRHALLEFGGGVIDGVAGFHGRQDGIALVVGFRFRHDVKLSPTRLLDDFAARRESFALELDDNLRLVVNVERMKLHGVILRNERVNFQLDVGQGDCQRLARRDYGVVRGNFFVVPSAALNRGVGVGEQFLQASAVVSATGEVAQNYRRVAELRCRQKFAVGARVSRQFFFVEALRGVEDFLRRETECFSRSDLQRRQ